MTVAGESGWAIGDPVLHLRVRGARDPSAIYPLPGDAREVTIGSGADRSIRLVDPEGKVSRRHAVLTRHGTKWTARDDSSKNGIQLDGEHRSTFDLAPGAELGVGSIRLIAESALLIALRSLLDRWIGWSPARYLEIDRALRTLRYAATLRGSLVLRGSGDMTFLAKRLHLQMLGGDRPFVVVRGDEDGLAAVHAAAEGTLCLDAAHLPSRMTEVLDGLRSESFKARVTMCALSTDADADSAIARLMSPMVIDLPPLAARSNERERVLREYVAEAAADLDAAPEVVRPFDIDRLLEWPWNGLAEVASDAYRVVALRKWGVTASGTHLGLTHGAMSGWARRRKLATFSPGDLP